MQLFFFICRKRFIERSNFIFNKIFKEIDLHVAISILILISYIFKIIRTIKYNIVNDYCEFIISYEIVQYFYNKIIQNLLLKFT